MRSLGLGLSLTRSGGTGASFSVSIGSGPFITGATLTATVDNVEDGQSVTWVFQDDGVDIAGSGGSGVWPQSITYTAAIGTDSIADASLIRCVVTVDGGDPINSGSREIRYAAGTAPAVADGQSWTVDDTSVNIDASASGANLTFSYGATGLPAGVTINSGTGAITGTPTGASSGTATVTATDQYGRELTDTFTWASALRTQATAADGLGPFSWTVDDTSVSVDATTDFTANGNTLTYTATGLPAGVSIASNGIISGTPTAASSGSIVITGQDEYARETTSTTSHTTALRTQATGGADLDLAYVEDSAITPQDLLANWTDNGNTLTFVSVSPSLPTGLSINSSGVLSGTPTTVTADATYTLTMQDEYARQTSDTFTLEITAASAAPTLDSVIFTDNNDGTPASLALNYTGDVTGYRVYIATGTDPLTVSTAQLYAGSGGTNTLEFTDFAVGTDIDVTGLTSTSESANRIAVCLIKSADGSDPSNIETVTVSGLDFTDPVLSSPTATAASATSITAGVTSGEANGTIYFAARLASDPVLSIANIENGTGDAVATGTDATPTADANNAATLTGLTQGTAYDIDMFQRDQDGNESAVVSSAAATTWDVPDAFVDADWSVATGSGSGELDVTIASLPTANGAAITDVEYDLDASGTWVSSGGTTSFTITGLTASTSYAVRLRAVNSVGNSAAGNSESATSGASSGNSISSITGSPTNTQSGGDEIYEWNADGSFTADATFTVTYLIVAGGGGGGGASGFFVDGGGGGAGGLLSGTFTAVSGQTYTVTRGLGGAGGVAGAIGSNGGTSGITVGTNAPGSATGGGGGGWNTTAGQAGGSGGGAPQDNQASAGAGTAGQGNDGGDGPAGNAGGGGGGAGAAGADGTSDGGAGGAGSANTITGSSVTYAGGGGAGRTDIGDAAGAGGAGGGGAGGLGASGSNGTDGLGGGGGGAGYSGANENGGDGGNGVVIIRFTP